MKTVLKIDYKIQIFGFIILLLGFTVQGFVTKEFLIFIRAFLYISLLQLASMIVRLMMNRKNGLFFHFYLLFSFSFWMYIMYEKSKFKFSYSLESIWLQLSIYSGFIYYYFLIFYLFYMHKFVKNKKT
ncbi:hypothetical protein AR685_03560 [Chryseobacterium sp. JAH]|nr:hypothetical protein AR685_03560 [Chryseobacterium sp. JAH]